MFSQKTRNLQVVDIDQLDLSKSFVVWSEVGRGTQHRLLDKFGTPEYHVCLLRSNLLDFGDFMALPVLNQKPVVPNWVLELKQIRDEGQKKIVLIFDEINIANPACVEIFEKIIKEHVISGLQLAPSDIVIARGVMDGSGACRETPISDDVMDSLEHYMLKPYF